MKLFFLSTLFQLFVTSTFSQFIPEDSLYLGQTPPQCASKIFNLSVTPGFFAAERMTISKDGRNIYYHELNGYSDTTKGRVKNYSYVNNKWTGPFILFEGLAAPVLSVTGDTIYVQNGKFETFFAVKNAGRWSNPKRLLKNINYTHYFQVTNNGHFYFCSKPEKGIGGIDRCMMSIHGCDTAVSSLGLPLNTETDDMDFFVSRDESFIIIIGGGAKSLLISYHKRDGRWTNPKSLDFQIKSVHDKYFWAPFITDDNRYLFFSKFPTLPNNRICWIRIDNLIDSLKHTNFVPYLKNQLKDQTTSPGHPISFSIPDSTFIDDDGNKTLSYTATLSNDQPLPAWLSFEPGKCAFSGTPAEKGELMIKVVATDTAKDSASCTFQLLTR